MRRGAWHQCGDKSQKLVIEQLEQAMGVGVIISARDLALNGASAYSETYRHLGAEVLIDLQFCNPEFVNTKLDTYGISQYRASVSQLHQISDDDLIGFASELRTIQSALSTTGVIAPAVKYEAGRPDIVQLNARLFVAAREVAEQLNLPLYATAILGSSVTSSQQTTERCLSEVTSLDCDGWYYGFEFPRHDRIPSAQELVLRCCMAGLKLAATGKPVLHAYAGPMALLSFGFGATAAGIGHWQNLWQFTRGRWETAEEQGGGGNAPPRLFSNQLWGTIIYPDEVFQIPPELRELIFTPSPFSPPNISQPSPSWSRWDANKHLVYCLCSAISPMAQVTSARANAATALATLQTAMHLHQSIANLHVALADNTNAYHNNWISVINALLHEYSDDFDYLELLT